MAFSKIQVSVEYVIAEKDGDTTIREHEEAATFEVAVEDLSAGSSDMSLTGFGNVTNVLGLAQVKSGETIDGYFLYRLKSLKTFAHDSNPDIMKVISCRLVLTWLDPSGEEESFKTAYDIEPKWQEAEDSIPNNIAPLSWEFLIKRRGDSDANYRYFLRRVISGGAGDGPFETCKRLKKVWDYVRQTQPDNKHAIDIARRNYLFGPCPPPG